MALASLLVALWVILLLRYPARAVTISAGSLVALLGLGSLTFWLEHRQQQALDALAIHIRLDAQCPAERPLQVRVHNTSHHFLHELRWQLSVHRSGERDELLASPQAAVQSAPAVLRAGEQWQQCLALPPLRPGYPHAGLQFEALRIRGTFH